MRRHPPEPEFITIRDAAALIAVCPATIRRYVAQGKLRGYAHGAQIVRVRLDEVRALLEPMKTVDQ